MSNARAWDDGCAEDEIRNGFVIPEIVQTFRAVQPRRILDLGAGTGYLARAIDSKLDYSPQWLLVDIDPHRLALAVALAQSSMQINTLTLDARDPLNSSEKFDAALLVFTLLETEEPEGLIATAVEAVTAGGMIVIVVPDLWAEIMNRGGDWGRLARAALAEPISLQKVDKFTGQPYPFHLMRAEALIALVLSYGCKLERLARGGPVQDIFAFTFLKDAVVVGEANA